MYRVITLAPSSISTSVRFAAPAPATNSPARTRISLPAPGVTVSEERCVPTVASSKTVPWKTHVAPAGQKSCFRVISVPHDEDRAADLRRRQGARVIAEERDQLVATLRAQAERPDEVPEVHAAEVRVAGDPRGR